MQISTQMFFNTKQVAKSYGLLSATTITDHFRRHADEFIENIHYVLEINKFHNKVIKWTLEGVYMLGFFIKSKKAKEYRKKVAKLLREQSEARLKTINNEITRLNSLNHHQILGYKSQLAQQKKAYENEVKALKYDFTETQKENLSLKNEIKALNKELKNQAFVMPKKRLNAEQLEALRMFLAKEYDMISLKIDWSLELLCQKLDIISYQAKLDYFKNKLAFQQGQKVRCFA